MRRPANIKTVARGFRKRRYSNPSADIPKSNNYVNLGALYSILPQYASACSALLQDGVPVYFLQRRDIACGSLKWKLEVLETFVRTLSRRPLAMLLTSLPFDMQSRLPEHKCSLARVFRISESAESGNDALLFRQYMVFGHEDDSRGLYHLHKKGGCTADLLETQPSLPWPDLEPHLAFAAYNFKMSSRNGTFEPAKDTALPDRGLLPPFNSLQERFVKVRDMFVSSKEVDQRLANPIKSKLEDGHHEPQNRTSDPVDERSEDYTAKYKSETSEVETVPDRDVTVPTETIKTHTPRRVDFEGYVYSSRTQNRVNLGSLYSLSDPSSASALLPDGTPIFYLQAAYMVRLDEQMAFELGVIDDFKQELIRLNPTLDVHAIVVRWPHHPRRDNSEEAHITLIVYDKHAWCGLKSGVGYHIYTRDEHPRNGYREHKRLSVMIHDGYLYCRPVETYLNAAANNFRGTYNRYRPLPQLAEGMPTEFTSSGEGPRRIVAETQVPVQRPESAEEHVEQTVPMKERASSPSLNVSQRFINVLIPPNDSSFSLLSKLPDFAVIRVYQEALRKLEIQAASARPVVSYGRSTARQQSSPKQIVPKQVAASTSSATVTGYSALLQDGTQVFFRPTNRAGSRHSQFELLLNIVAAFVEDWNLRQCSLLDPDYARVNQSTGLSPTERRYPKASTIVVDPGVGGWGYVDDRETVIAWVYEKDLWAACSTSLCMRYAVRIFITTHDLSNSYVRYELLGAHPPSQGEDFRRSIKKAFANFQGKLTMGILESVTDLPDSIGLALPSFGFFARQKRAQRARFFQDLPATGSAAPIMRSKVPSDEPAVSTVEGVSTIPGNTQADQEELSKAPEYDTTKDADMSQTFVSLKSLVEDADDNAPNRRTPGLSDLDATGSVSHVPLDQLPRFAQSQTVVRRIPNVAKPDDSDQPPPESTIKELGSVTQSDLEETYARRRLIEMRRPRQKADAALSASRMTEQANITSQRSRAEERIPPSKAEEQIPTTTSQQHPRPSFEQLISLRSYPLTRLVKMWQGKPPEPHGFVALLPEPAREIGPGRTAELETAMNELRKSTAWLQTGRYAHAKRQRLRRRYRDLEAELVLADTPAVKIQRIPSESLRIQRVLSG